MKIKEVEVERKVLYEKCKNCKQSLLDKKITNYRKRKEYLENYLFLFIMLCTTTMILTAFQQEAFWKDTVDFFTTFLNGCGEVLEMIADAECGLAQLLADMISQPIWRNVVYWIALALLFIITGILLFFICHMAWDKYRKKVQSGINIWTVSIAILLLMVVVYLGDYIRMILPMNLFLLFHLLGLDGIYGYDCNVTTSENTTTDGSTYQGSTAKERNIVITAEIDGDYRKNRELLYRVFPKGRTGTLEYSEDGDIKTITYRVESVTPGATTGVVRDYTISLICTDPYFKDLSDVEVVMASWVSDWYFENGFDINGVEFGHREAELVKEIENNNGADNIGITAIFRADGIVKNPAIYHSESGKYIKVGYAGNDFELQSGQYVVIFTHTGKKNIYLLDGVSQAEIEEHKDRYGMIDWETVVSMYGTIINQYLDEDGDFIQLQDGTNTITYNAESGINYLSVSVYYRISYLGV